MYIVDTHAWIEYFMGSKSGFILKKLFTNINNKFITIECSLAELKFFCVRESINFENMLQVIKKDSIILPVLQEHWLEAAQIKYEIRKKIKDFGLIDSILVAKQNEFKCHIVSGNRHFKGMKNIVYIGD